MKNWILKRFIKTALVYALVSGVSALVSYAADNCGVLKSTQYEVQLNNQYCSILKTSNIYMTPGSRISGLAGGRKVCNFGSPKHLETEDTYRLLIKDKPPIEFKDLKSAEIAFSTDSLCSKEPGSRDQPITLISDQLTSSMKPSVMDRKSLLQTDLMKPAAKDSKFESMPAENSASAIISL